MSATVAIDAIRDAVAAVDDPEFPGVSIEHLGILRGIRSEGDAVVIELLPTFLGCPALETIASDVEAAASGAGAKDVDVVFVNEPAWSPDLITVEGRRLLAREFTVAVRSSRVVHCPNCGSSRVEERSPFGPTACRAIAYCSGCRNPVEVMKT